MCIDSRLRTAETINICSWNEYDDTTAADEVSGWTGEKVIDPFVCIEYWIEFLLWKVHRMLCAVKCILFIAITSCMNVNIVWELLNKYDVATRDSGNHKPRDTIYQIHISACSSLVLWLLSSHLFRFWSDLSSWSMSCFRIGNTNLLFAD